MVQKQLVAYTDTELDEQTRLKVDNHLSACGKCRSALSLLESTKPGPGTPQEQPPEFWAPMHQAILKELETSPPPPKNLRWGLLYGTAMILTLAWLVQNNTTLSPPDLPVDLPTQASTLPLQP